jgi:TPR repeat protein
MGMNNSKAWNALGYMYYYGLGVEKNIKRAYDYFKISFTKGEESDAYYDMVTLLSESNGKIEVDFPNAYKYANFIAAKGHTFGTHFFGMMNEYQLGSIVKTCEITVEFFKQVSERNLPGKRKFDSAIKFYKEGLYKISALLYIELAEEGFEVNYRIKTLVWTN